MEKFSLRTFPHCGKVPQPIHRHPTAHSAPHKIRHLNLRSGCVKPGHAQKDTEKTRGKDSCFGPDVQWVDLPTHCTALRGLCSILAALRDLLSQATLDPLASIHYLHGLTGRSSALLSELGFGNDNSTCIWRRAPSLVDLVSLGPRHYQPVSSK